MKLLSSIHIIDVGSKLKVVMVWWGVGESNLQKCIMPMFAKNFPAPLVPTSMYVQCNRILHRLNKYYLTYCVSLMINILHIILFVARMIFGNIFCVTM